MTQLVFTDRYKEQYTDAIYHQKSYGDIIVLNYYYLKTFRDYFGNKNIVVLTFVICMSSLFPHYMQLPRNILIGKDVLNRLTSVCRSLGFRSSIFVLTGPKVYKLTTQDIVKKLEKSNYQVELAYVTNSNIDSVKKVTQQIKKFKPEVVLGIGGGTVIDVAKLSATYEDIPFVSIPTAASHDGISSSRASIKGVSEPASIKTQAPIAIIADTNIIINAPYKLTASGCGDIISKYTAVKDWKLAHQIKNEYYGEYAANLALMSAKLVMKNAKIIAENSEVGLRIVLEALISCGVAMSIAGSSRPCSGSEHLFSHALDLLLPKPKLHGEQCGVGAIMMAYLQKGDWRMIRKNLKILRAPASAKELGINAKYIIKALVLAHKIRPDRYTILGSKGLSKKEAQILAKATKVIE